MLMIVKKSFYIFLVSMIVLSIFIGSVAAEENQDRYGGTLNLGFVASPPMLDWMCTTNEATAIVSMYIWEHLIVYDENDELRPMLAKNWELSKDGLTWTFYLREGILFHNGKEMTAEDTVASARRWVNIGTATKMLQDVKSIEVVDKYTFKINTNQKLGSLPSLIAIAIGGLIIMPKEVCDSPSGQLTEYIGTGPYMFEEWKLDQYIKLKRFSDYKSIDLEPSFFAGKKYAYFDTIMINFVPEISTLQAGLETGIFDIIEPVDILEVPRLREKGFEVARYPYRAIKQDFNNTGYGIFKDVRIKLAVIKALDYEELMRFIGKTEEGYEMLPGQFAKDSIWYTKIREEQYNKDKVRDIDGAKKLMKEAGYNGEELVILCTTDYQFSIDGAILEYQQLSEVGFNVKLDIKDWATLVATRVGGAWDIQNNQGRLVTDPLSVVMNYMGDNYNGYTSPEIQEEIFKLIREDTYEKRYQAWENVERILIKDPAIFTPGLVYQFRAAKSNIKDFAKTMWPMHWNAYRE